MSKLEQHLSQYAAYHLDRKNIYTHFIGIPMIVLSIICLSARASFTVASVEFNLALLILVVSTLFYLSLDKIFAALMLLFFVVIYPFAAAIADLPFWPWLLSSLSLFMVGWIFQFVGHLYEKKKPAFVDDVMGLAIGPLFVLAEAVFLLGFRKELEQRILQEGKRQRALMDQKPILDHS